MKNKFIFIFLLLLAIPILFAQEYQNNKIIKIGIESDIEVLGPWESVFAVNAKIFWNVFETLVTFEEKSTKIKPNLAISWQVSNNNRTWTFKLRDGVKFHDGNSLTADDVVASSIFFNEFKGTVEKVNNSTVRFTLEKPHSGFLNRLVDIMYGIAPSSNIDSYQELKRKGNLDEFIPIGSGPFKFSNWEKGKHITLEPFADYWQGKPEPTALVYQIIPDNKARLSDLEKRKIDVIDVIYPADLPRINRNPNLKIVSIYGMNVCFIAINTIHSPLDNKKIRQALNLAVDKARLIRKFHYRGFGAPTNRVLSPAFGGFGSLINSVKYRPEIAKRMLSEAGYEKNLSFELLCIPMARPYLPDPKGVAEDIKKQLANVGVDIYITMPSTYSEYNDIIKKDSYDMTLAGWIDVTGDPDYTLSSLLSSSESLYNESHWHNNLFNDKLQAARRLPFNDVKGRTKLYNEAQKIFQDEAPWIPLFHTKNFVIHNRKINGIIIYPSSMISYHKVRFNN